MIFTSDNAAGVAAPLLDAVARAAHGPAMPYGADDATARVERIVRAVFEAPEARVYLVGTGTAANALALACLSPPWGAIYTHRLSHAEVDECGAPEFYTGGAKLTLLDGADGRIDPDELDRMASGGRGVHRVQNGAVSITNATELGTVYDPDAVARIARIAHRHEMGLHMDGTRFANAVARLGVTPAELSWKAGVDILCLGATKCGAMAAEAVILFDPARAWEFELRRKRGGHLFSKMRFVAAQMEAWLEDGLWLELARHANAMADRLADGLRRKGVPLRQPVEANLLFPTLTAAQHRRLGAEGARYYARPEPPADAPDDHPVEVRLVCSFETPEHEVDGFAALL